MDAVPLLEDPFASLMLDGPSFFESEGMCVDFPPPAQPLTQPGYIDVDESGSAYVFPAVEFPSEVHALPVAVQEPGSSVSSPPGSAGGSSSSSPGDDVSPPRPVRRRVVYRCKVSLIKDLEHLRVSEPEHPVAGAAHPVPESTVVSFPSLPTPVPESDDKAESTERTPSPDFTVDIEEPRSPEIYAPKRYDMISERYEMLRRPAPKESVVGRSPYGDLFDGLLESFGLPAAFPPGRVLEALRVVLCYEARSVRKTKFGFAVAQWKSQIKWSLKTPLPLELTPLQKISVGKPSGRGKSALFLEAVMSQGKRAGSSAAIKTTARFPPEKERPNSKQRVDERKKPRKSAEDAGRKDKFPPTAVRFPPHRPAKEDSGRKRVNQDDTAAPPKKRVSIVVHTVASDSEEDEAEKPSPEMTNPRESKSKAVTLVDTKSKAGLSSAALMFLKTQFGKSALARVDWEADDLERMARGSPLTTKNAPKSKKASRKCYREKPSQIFQGSSQGF